MRDHLSPRRWFAFILSATVLVAGLVILSAQATENGLAPAPEPAPPSATNGNSGAVANGDGIVVDRLDTWAETKGKGKVSRAKGGGKSK